jgi:hypothetical protein
MHKIMYKTCRNKMLICSCGVPPKSCSRVIGSPSLSYTVRSNEAHTPDNLPSVIKVFQEFIIKKYIVISKERSPFLPRS